MKIFMVILIGISFFLPGCAYAVRHDGPYDGRVIDAETGEPIESAVVLGVWYKQYPGPAGAISEFYDAKETVTDTNGEFSISGMGLEILSNVIPMDVLIFKAGHEYIGPASWSGFKTGYLLSKIIKWEGEKAIIPLRKLTMKQRKKQDSPSIPFEAPGKSMKLMLMEINKDRLERGLLPVGTDR